MKLSDVRSRISPDLQDLSTKLLDLATASWNAFKHSPEVTQELAKDPFTGPIKEQSGIAECLLLLLHICDRVASAALRATVTEHAAATLRHSLMSALVGATIPAFVQAACPDEEEDEQEETQTDLLHLYNARAIQYGFFALGASQSPHESEALLTVASIRLAEALEAAENADIIGHGMEVVITSVETLRERLPLKGVIGRMIAGARE
ncbi:MAG: hypothetical protein HOP18_10470 [Deltaproteobacteria bacterium]|nr:hypothetical protein [Deltaproteobacteria bacterium]